MASVSAIEVRFSTVLYFGRSMMIRLFSERAFAASIRDGHWESSISPVRSRDRKTPEWAAIRLLVNAVSPGFTLTELTARTLEKSDFQALSSRVPLERFADPEEIAGIVVFLASGWNTYLTGQNITVDGGYSIV